MSREQGPRAAGMRPTAIAARRRHPDAEIGKDGSEGGGMSREQGPRAAGMRPTAITASRRRRAAYTRDCGKEAAI